MPLELSDAAKVAIELYLKEINEKAEDLHHQRIVRYTAILGLFTAAIGALLVWTLTTGARDAAIAAATAETRRLLNSDPVVETINSNLKRADNTASQSSRSAAVSHFAASEAEASLNTLRTDLAQSQEVVSAVKKIGGDLSSAASAVVNTPAFQDAVVTKATQNVTQNILSELSGLSGTIVFVHENGQCPAGYSDHNTFLLPRWKAAYNTDKFQTPQDPSGPFNNNPDWIIDHIRLCIRQ